jgi:tetratricopeptide (TPR) repeat protein
MKKISFILILFSISGNLSAQWNTDRIMTIGRNALFFEDYVLAIQYFNQVISVKPYLAEPFMYRGMAKAQLGDFQGADADCTEAINRNPFIPQAYYTRGFARQRLGFFQDAVDDFTKALEFSPNSGFLLLSRMSALANLGNYEDALVDLERYMQMNPRMTELLYEKGRLQMALNDTIGAQQTFDQFVEVEPYNSMAWSARALLRLQQEDLDGALADYNRAIELNSKFSGDYINRGIIHVRRYNFMQALSDYDRAIEIDRNSTLAFYNRALLRANLGDTNNALEDLKTVLRQDDSQMEAHLRKAMLEIEIGNFSEAINDYRIIIARYPDFLPAYMGIAQAYRALGNRTESQRYAIIAMDIEEKLAQARENPSEETGEEIVADNLIAEQTQRSNPSRRTEMFNRFTAQNMERAERESRFANHTRGTVQDQHTDLVNERNFVLTFYARPDGLRRTNLFHPLVEIKNRERKLSSVLRITNNEIPLTEELVRMHFSAIQNLSAQITTETNDADIFFSRAMEFAMVQDFIGAINDLNKAILLRPDFTLAYFMRANLRHKQTEYENHLDEIPTFETEKRISLERQYNFDAEMILRDYDRVIALAPDFQYAHFNKANVLASLHDFQSAISHYTRAIELDPNFAEAYFNRGLIYLFIGEDTAGMSDLSKAGELGMYRVYNLIQRFNQ